MWARISPDRNSRDGARIAASTERSRGPSSVMIASAVDVALPRGRLLERLAEHFVEAAARRVDHQLHFLIRGNPRALLGGGHRDLQPAQLIDQPDLLGLLARPHPPLPDLIDLLRRGLPRSATFSTNWS